MKRLFVLMMAVALILSIVACGDGQGGSTTDNESSSIDQSAEPTENNASEQNESQLKKYKGEIVVSINYSVTDREGFDGLVAEYNKYQPDVKVIWEPKEGTDYPTWLGVQVASGNPRPDVVAANYQPTYDKYVNFDKYRKMTNPYTGNKWDEDIDWDFYVTRNNAGERILLPTQAVHIMWFYNEDIFDEVGVQPPTTWDELAEVSEKIKAAGITPIATNFIYKIPQWLAEVYWDQYSRPWHEIVRAQPGDYCYDEELDGKFKYDPNDPYIDLKYTFNQSRYYKAIRDHVIRFDTPEMTDFITNMKKVFPQYATSDLFVLQDDYPLFLQQKVAMIIDGSWSLPTLNEDMKNLGDKERLGELKIDTDTQLKPFNWSTFENPPITSDLITGPIRSIESATGEYLGIIDKNQQQTEMVLDFVMFWTSKVGYQPYVDAQVKANKFRPGGPIMVKGVETPDEIQKMFDGIKMMGNAEISMNQLFTNTVGGPSGYSKQAFDMFKEALEGKMAPEEFGKRFQKMVDDNFDNIIKIIGLKPENIEHPEKAPN